MNVTQKISQFVQINITDSSIYCKSERQTFDGFAFVTACYNFHLTILPQRPTDTLFHRCKHLHTYLAARNTLIREISRPIRTILVFYQIICVSFGIYVVFLL